MEFHQSKLFVENGSMDVGLPISSMTATADLGAVVVDGDLHALAGTIDSPSMMLAQRAVKNFRTNIVKPAGRGFYQFSELHGKLAGGKMAGQVDLDVPKEGESRFGVRLVLHQCDVKELAGEKEDKLRGRLNASVELEGDWSNSSTRRGRGDIQVQGNDLYELPVVMGLLQITNLSLPIKSGFNDATTHYVVEGPKVTFEQIELRANNMLMQGSGSINFDTKKVGFTFFTDNPNWPKIPVISEFLSGAKRELFQIHVRGTVTEPEIKARSMNTFRTTIDDVFEGKEKPTSRPKKK